MSGLYDIFSLLNASANIDEFIVEEIPEVQYHKIGISQNKYPMFFIKSEYSGKHILDQSLEIIAVQFNKECNLYNENGLNEKGTYTVITLKSYIPEIQKYFIDILYLLIKKLPVIPNLKDIREELNSLVELFRGFSKPSLKSIQGIWAELLIIDRSNNPDYLIKAWHSSILSKFDFNDGIDKIEVKSTTKDRRIHRFSHSQLESNTSSHLIIASILTTQTGLGLNIFDLRKRIFDNLIDKDLIIRIDEIFSKTLGNDIIKASDYYFDYHSAIDYLKFYDSKDIPTIGKSEIPIQISNIKFDCDFSDFAQINLNNFDSILLSALNNTN